MRSPSTAIFTLAAALAPLPAAAQASDSQLWLGGSATADVADHVPASLDTTLRFGDAAHGLYEWARGGTIGVRTAGGAELLGGYQRVTGYTDGHVTRVEQRIRQQLNLAFGRLAGATLAGRIRVEERFRQHADGMGLRARFQLRATRPLGDGATPALLLSHESFVELNDTSWGQHTGLRRMRNLIGLDMPVSKQLRLQLGYLNQYDFGLPGKRDQMANILSLVAVARF